MIQQKKPSTVHKRRKGLETKGFRGFDVLRIIASEVLFLFIQFSVQLCQGENVPSLSSAGE